MSYLAFSRFLFAFVSISSAEAAKKICYPYFGLVNDYGWTYVQNVARSFVDFELATVSDYAEGVYFLSPDFPFPPTPGQEAIYEGFAQDCDVIFAGSDVLDPVTRQFAKKYPNIKFIIVGHIPRPSVPNYAFAYIRAYQGKYIGGMVAASQPGVTTLGYVGSYPGPLSYINVNAFYLGAVSVNPNIKFYNINVMSWYDLEKERIAALQLIALYDVDLLTFDSDSDEVCKVAAEQGKLSVGYKGDNAIANGNSVLVSVVFDWRQTYKQLIQSALDGTWNATKTNFEWVGFDEHAVSMGTFSTKVNATTREKANKLAQDFEAKIDNVYCSPTGGFVDTNGLLQKPLNGGNCLSLESENSDLQQMNWLVGGITDLGPLSTKPAIKSCYVFAGRTSDFGWTYVQDLARNYVDVNLAGATSEYVESVDSMSDPEQRDVLDGFINKNCHVIIFGSDGFSAIASEYAAQHPDTKFVVAGPRSNVGHANLATAYIRTYQGKYVAGMIAASQPGVTKIGYVGSIRISDAMKDANAFYMGAKSVKSDIEFAAIYTGSWHAPKEERIAALQLFYLHGAQLVTYDSDSDTVCKIAHEQGKLSVGYKSDCTLRYGDSNLASVVLNWDEIFYTLTKAERDGLWKAMWQDMEYVGFGRAALTLGTYSSKVDMATRSQATKLMASFAAGNDAIWCQTLNNQSGHAITPDGNGCFTDDYLYDKFDWLQEGIEDLGVMPAPKDAIKTCYAFFGPITDFGWTYAQNLARNWIDANYEGSTSEYVENVAFMEKEEQQKVLDTFVTSNCEVVVLSSGVFSAIANEYAALHPQINWIGAGLWYNLGNANLATAYIRIYQGKYVAGMIAASQPGVTKIGYVGSMRLSDAMKDANAFYMGAKSVNPDIEFVAIYTGSWFAPREERIATLRLFHQDHVDLVSYDSDSDTVCKIAAQEGKLSVGYKSDCTVTWGNSNLASVVLDWKQVFKLLIAATKDGLWSARSKEVEFVGFDQAALTMGTFSTKVDMSTRRKAETLMASFAAGEEGIFCGTLKNQSGHTITPDGNGCFTDDYLHSKLDWLQEGIEDLGVLDVPETCSAGQKQDALAAELCVDCLAGSFTDAADATECEACSVGRFANMMGSTECVSCPAGTHAAGQGSDSCSGCPNGTYSTGGSSSCNACPPGRYREGGSAAMISSCENCKIATYASQEGSTRCNSCEAGYTTRYPAATSDTDCLCAEGYYKKASGCAQCGTGVICELGAEPQQLGGYWIDVKSSSRRLTANVEYSVYKCRSHLECPQGLPGTCAPGRTGVACAVCKDNHFKGDDGICEPCGGTGPLPFIAAVVAMLCTVVVLYMFSAMDPSKQKMTLVTIVACMGQLATMVQALGAFRGMSITWVEPVKSFLDIMSLLTLDLDVIRMSCLLGVDNPPLKYLSRLLVYPFLVCSLGIMLGIMRMAGRQLDLNRFINSQGVLILIFYISLAVSSLLPFQCVPNPNGTWAMSTNPAVICWSEGHHTPMVVMGIFGVLFYPVLILALVARITYQFPKRIAAGDGIQTVKRYRWLFNRFRMETYFYGVAYLTRNLFIALVPTIFAFSSEAQVLAMGFILTMTAVMQVRVWPWRTVFGNVSDMFINTLLILTMFGVSLLLPDSQSPESVAWYLQSLLFFTLIVVLVTMSVMAYRHLVPRLYYGAFLCHHKGGAANLGRLFKLKLAPLTSAEVFLDSDELETLDLLYDTVRGKVQNLVILMTKEIFFRMWCCGEITTAVKNNVRIVPVQCEDFVAPDDDTYDYLEKSWTHEQWATLATMGVQPEDMRMAYKTVMGLPIIKLNRSAPFSEQLATIQEVAKACKFHKASSSTLSYKAPENTDILLVGATKDVEAMCACEILREQFQKITQVQCSVACSVADAEKYSTSATYVVVVLTKGLFKDSGFAESVLAFAKIQRYPGANAVNAAEVVTVLADQTFDFPSSKQRKEAAVSALRSAGKSDYDLETLIDCYDSTLKILAINVNFYASWKVSSVQIQELSRRFKKYSGGNANNDIGPAVSISQKTVSESSELVKAEEQLMEYQF